MLVVVACTKRLPFKELVYSVELFIRVIVLVCIPFLVDFSFVRIENYDVFVGTKFL